MHFTKMQGLGNDYLYVYGPVPADAPALSRRLSNRHFGPGADGMIYITPSATADFGMRIFNADGSEAAMCGNGIRCVGKYVYDRGHTAKTDLTVETASGIRRLRLHTADGRVTAVSVDMGQTRVSPPTTVEGLTLHPTTVGNPHAVTFVDAADSLDPADLGPQIESAFPGGINVEFVTPLTPTHLRMRVWERGSGVTLACGTGACASVAAAVETGKCPPATPITVTLDGGDLTVTLTPDGRATMTGPATFVYDGETCT